MTGKTLAEAIGAWNRRPPPAAVGALVEALEPFAQAYESAPFCSDDQHPGLKHYRIAHAALAAYRAQQEVGE